MRTERIVCDRCGAEDDLHPYTLKLTPDDERSLRLWKVWMDLCGSCAEAVRRTATDYPTHVTVTE